MITLYGIEGSRASRNMWMLNELGLDYESVPINDRSGETRTPEFLAINPNGKVPCLVDGDVKLVESMAINLHLANKYNNGMWFDSPDEQGEAMQWSFWGMLEIDGHIMDVLTAGSRADADKGLTRLQSAAAVLDSRLAGSEYLVANRYSVADLNAASGFSGGAFMKYTFGEFSNLSRWLRACYTRPQAAVPNSTLVMFRDLLAQSSDV